MNVFGIETSCDETAAAIVVDGQEVLSSTVASQIELHRPYGGVVPEIASRNHVLSLPQVSDEALTEAGMSWSDIDIVAATYGPGLASSLLVGLSSGKGLALRLGKPFVGINHLEAHLYSVFLSPGAPNPNDIGPFVGLLVSGGHTCLIQVEKLGTFRLLGQTVDDAAGEAFDKGANLLGLEYPGGPAIEKCASGGKRDHVTFPRGLRNPKTRDGDVLDRRFCFSFSGLKTALLYHLRDDPLVPDDRERLANLAASYQEAIVDSLVEKTEAATHSGGVLVAAGGVVLNSRLRDRLRELADRKDLTLLMPERAYCMDNAAMVAGLAGAGQGVREDTLALDAQPNLGIGH